ncbi:unnamed protein product [Caenorhabditis sp. 36 PRJEB53466]|nr:unnamed protein product [Caenorhabditis sp. 36 PRJEB53466]
MEASIQHGRLPKVGEGNNLISYAALMKIANYYFPTEGFEMALEKSAPKALLHLAELNQKQICKEILAKTRYGSRQYGSAEELEEALMKFGAFTGADKVFDVTPGEPFYIHPTIYKGQMDKMYICKMDLFTLLKKWVFDNHDEMSITFIRCSFMLFIRMKEEMLATYAEYVPLDHTNVVNLGTDLDNIMETVRTVREQSNKDREVVFPVDTVDDVLGQWRKLFPKCHPHDYHFISELLAHCYHSVYPFNAEAFTESYQYSSDLFESIERLIQKRQELFFPMALQTKKELPPTLRVFDDNGRKFVMTSEAINLFSVVKGVPTLKSHDLTIMEVDEPFLASIPKTNIIVTQIKRVKNAAVPVMSSSGDACILATDALFELLQEIITGFKMFQKIKRNEWHVVKTVFNKLGRISFLHSLPGAYFFNLKENTRTRSLVFEHFSKFDDRFVEDIMDVGLNGFSAQDLADELGRLGLVKIFPEIKDYVRVAYNRVVKCRKTKFLRSCDLYDALEHCQLLCFFNRFPNFVKFLHNQKSCKRLEGLHCQFCDEPKPRFDPVREVKAVAKKTEKRVTRRNEEDRTVLKAKRTMNKPVKVEQPAPEAVKQTDETERRLKEEEEDPREVKQPALEATEETVEKENDPPATIPKAAKKEDKKKKGHRKMTPEKVLSPPNSSQQPESKVCEKCVRTSDRCEKVKERLKKSEKNNEELKTALRKTERELQEKDRKLEEMEKKMREMEEKLAAQTEMVQEAEKLKGAMEQMKVTNVQQLQKKMKRQEEKIEMLNLETTAFSIKCLKNQQLIDRLLAERDATSESPKGPELTEEMKEMLHELEEKMAELKETDPVGKVNEQCELLESLAEEDDALKQLASEELKTFKERQEDYERTLQENIKRIKETKNIARDQLLELPEFPTLSAKFTKAYEKAMYETNLEECPVCLERMDPATMRLVKCTSCRMTFQEDCVEMWHQSKGETCPHCRGSILDFVQLPLTG